MIDKSKKSNIKCEHCKYREKHSGEVSYSEEPMFPGVKELELLTVPTWTTDLDVCKCPNSPKFNKGIYYYNRCKFFDWE